MSAAAETVTQNNAGQIAREDSIGVDSNLSAPDGTTNTSITVGLATSTTTPEPAVKPLQQNEGNAESQQVGLTNLQSSPQELHSDGKSLTQNSSEVSNGSKDNSLISMPDNAMTAVKLPAAAPAETEMAVTAPSEVDSAQISSTTSKDDKGGETPMDVDQPLNGSTASKPTSQSTVNNANTKADVSDTKTNESSGEKQCYCGKERNFGSVELQCGGCLKWFHDTCISYAIGKCVPFMTNYSFLCKECNVAKVESFTKKQANFSQMSATAIANLCHQSKVQNTNRVMFSKDKEIIPFIEKNWEHLTTMPRRVKQTWHNTVMKSMLKDSEIFMYEERGLDSENAEMYPMFGLVTQDLEKIGPNYESLVKTSQSKLYDPQMTQLGGGVTVGKGRAAKRKVPGDSQSLASSKKARSDLTMPKLPPHGYPFEHPFNKDGYRYILAEPDPHAPFRQEFDESPDWAGKPIPGWLYRKLVPNSIYMALHDRAPQIKLSEDRLTITGEKGYCMIRATHGISHGTWYFECAIEDMPENSAARLGWSQELGNLQAPLGYDRFSYSWRSRKGTRFHQSCGFHYSDEGFGQGDVVGFLIHLPNYKDYTPLPPTYKDKPLIKFKSYLYFEEKDEVQEAIEKLKPLPNSKIIFYKNGQSKGVAWKDINEGTYYPAVSLYKSCTVHVNFGPNFKYPPKEMNFRPMSDTVHNALIEQTMADILYLTENEGKLRLPNLEMLNRNAYQEQAEPETMSRPSWKRALSLMESYRNKRLGKA